MNRYLSIPENGTVAIPFKKSLLNRFFIRNELIRKKGSLSFRFKNKFINYYYL